MSEHGPGDDAPAPLRAATQDHPLDNPIWASLTTRHRRFALGSDSVRRYPADVGPFVAVAQANIAVERQRTDELGSYIGIRQAGVLATIALYERLGFVERARLGLWLVQRP